MISFFKKIRKSAIVNSNFRRIALYALGEIFLVVIGILIAVSINNWNKERSDRQATKASLLGLLSDLKKDSARLSFLHAEYHKNTARCDSIISRLELSDSDPQRSTIIRYDFIRFFSLNPSTAAFEEMKNSGKLYTLSNIGLSSSITQYYTNLDRNESYIENGHERIRFHMDQPTLNDYWLAVRKKNNDTHLKWIEDKESSTHQAFEFLVYLAKGRFRSNKQKVKQIKQQAAKLVRLIELEIERI